MKGQLLRDLSRPTSKKFPRKFPGNVPEARCYDSLFSSPVRKNSTKKIYIGCYNNYLMSLNITLPVITEDNAQQSLSSLIQQAPNSPHENDCSKQLTIMAPPNGA